MSDIDAGVEKEAVGTDDQTGVEAEDSGAPQNQDDTEKKALEAELVKTRQERDNYKTALTQKRQLIKNSPKEEIQEDEDAPVTKKDLDRVFQAVKGNTLKETINALVKDPAKREIVEHLYETRFSQMGTSDEAIRSGVQDAIDLADSRINKRKAEEITRKANMQTSPPLNGSSNEPAPVSKNHKFSEAQVQALTARAKSLGADPQKFIETAWKHQNRG